MQILPKWTVINSYAEYGKQLMKLLSAALTNEFGKGGLYIIGNLYHFP